VLIADDQELIRHALQIILDHQPDFAIVGQASDGAEAIRLARLMQPDIVLMDLKMPHVSGIEATRAISAEQPATQIVVLTTYDTDDLVFAAIRAGAQAYVLKDTGSEALLDILRDVHAGVSRLEPGVARKVLNEFRRISAVAQPGHDAAPPVLPATGAFEVLTERETDVLTLIAQGKSNKAIGAELCLSEGTVKNYVSRIMAKLHANDRTQMVLIALRNGMVRL
jgi:DNA-binding NarL/FixJ family response regulator